MEKGKNNSCEPLVTDNSIVLKQMDEVNSGIIKELGELPPETIITEKALGKVFCRHLVSIKRAIERGELPPSIRLFGESVWTIRAIQEHIARRLDQAKKESERLERRINQLSS